MYFSFNACTNSRNGSSYIVSLFSVARFTRCIFSVLSFPRKKRWFTKFSSTEAMPLKAARPHSFWSRGVKQFKIVDVQTSEADSELAPVNLGPLNFVCRRASQNEHLTVYFFLKTKNTKQGGRLKCWLIFHFMEVTHEPMYQDKWNCAQ